MAIGTKGIGIKHWGLFIFGIFLLLIGLGASFYVEGEYVRRYPYQSVGLVLVLIGVVFVALGFFYSPRTSETREKERVSIPAPPE